MGVDIVQLVYMVRDQFIGQTRFWQFSRNL